MEDEHYVRLIGAWSANDADDFNIYNDRLKTPINSENAEYIKQRIRARINRASVLLCIIGSTTHTSGWVSWEIDFTKSQGKGLVGVELSAHNRRPDGLLSSNCFLVPFKEDQIKMAIELAATM